MDERMDGPDAEELKKALAFHAAGVAIVAVRDEDRVHALTVTAFMPVSIEPPLMIVSFGANAAALPFVDPGTELTISLLGGGQASVASRYADTFPVGEPPFPEDGPPIVRGSLVALVCDVEEVLPRGDHHVVVARVREVEQGEGEEALVRYRRTYKRISHD